MKKSWSCSPPVPRALSEWNCSMLLKSGDNISPTSPPRVWQLWVLVFKRVHRCHKQACKALCSQQPWQNQYYFHGRSCGCNPDNKFNSPASGCLWVWLLEIKLHFNLKTAEALGKTVRTLLFSVATGSDLVLLSNHVSLTLQKLSRRVGPKDKVPSGFAHI